MTVIITPRAEADILHHHEWGVQRFGSTTAARTFTRVADFLTTTLAALPRAAGRKVREDDL
jgi:plasmid stabilization system protein ParE